MHGYYQGLTDTDKSMGERAGAMESVGIMKSFWWDRPTLVTGATGFLGNWLVKRLVDSKADVVCLMRDWVPQSELVRVRLIERVKIVRGDVCDQSVLERIMGEYEINTVFHLAAQTIVSIANRNPISTFETNIRGTWSLLEACRRSPTVKQIVIASSDKAYGDQVKLPYRENMPLKGKHPYDVSKSCADLIAQSYTNTYRLPVSITRCGNLYGGGDLNWNRIIPGTIRSILRGERPIIRSDGNFIRDYLYVEDGAVTYMHLAEQLTLRPEIYGEAFNFSNEIKITVLQIVGQILQMMASPLQPDIRNEVCNEIRDQYLSAEKAKKILNWKPLFDFHTGLEKTISWYKEYLSDENRNSKTS